MKAGLGRNFFKILWGRDLEHSNCPQPKPSTKIKMRLSMYGIIRLMHLSLHFFVFSETLLAVMC